MAHLKRWREDHPDDRNFMINARPSYYRMKDLPTPSRSRPKRPKPSTLNIARRVGQNIVFFL